MKVCNFDVLKESEDGQYIAEECGKAEGELMTLDMVMDFSNYHRTFRRYPFCKPASCEPSDIIKYYDYITKFFTGELSGEEQIDDDFANVERKLSITESTVNSCDETANFKASMKQMNGKVLAKTCRWLKNRPVHWKKKYCEKTTGFGGYSPAVEVCPSSCCACEEDSDNVFLKKTRIDEKGFLKIESKTCEWLSKASESAKNNHCSKKAASYAGGFPPAYIACPETCGLCPFE